MNKRIEFRIRDAGDHWIEGSLEGWEANTPDGRPALTFAVDDITGAAGGRFAVGDSALLRTVVETTPTPVFICDPDATVRSASAALTRELNWSLEAVTGIPLYQIVSPADHEKLALAMSDTPDRRVALNVHLLDTNDIPHPYRLDVSDLREDPAVAGFVVFATDTNELQVAIGNLERVASMDELTGLPNRKTLMEELHRRLANPNGRLAVLLCDIDGFKAVNDLFGHSKGDAVLRDVATKLNDKLRDCDLVARLGGDEFVVLCEVTDSRVVDVLIDRIERIVSNLGAFDHSGPLMSISVGAVLARSGDLTADEVIAEADNEMNRAKAWRRGLAVLPDTVSERRRLAAELIQGFNKGEIEAHFQPKVDLRCGAVCSFETLIRWRHPTRGLLTPDAFLAVCEEAGLEGRLAEVTIRSATELLRLTPDGVSVSVNLSPLQLAAPRITEAVLDSVDSGGITRSRFEVEITEQSVLDRLTRDGRRVPEVVEELFEAGISVAIDDFGTGTASLTRLVEMPATTLKIDQSFVAGLGSDPVATALVRAGVALAAELGLDVVAEGVETLLQVEMLSEMNCRFAQGWLYAKAAPLEEALTMVGAVLAPQP